MNAHSMKILPVSLIAAALAASATPAFAQHEGHTMPMPAARPAPKKAVPKPVAKKTAPPSAAKKPAAKQPAARPSTRSAGSMQGMDHSNMPGMNKAAAPAPAARKPAAGPAAGAASMQGMDHSNMPGMQKPEAKPTAPTPPGTDAEPAAGSMQGMDHSNMPGMTRGTTPESGAQSMEGMDHSKMEGMDHSNMAGMDHSNMAGMDHAATEQQADSSLPANAAPRTPIPTLTDDDRAAAFPPDAHGHEVHDSRPFSYVLFDRLEWQDNEHTNLAWDAIAWRGGDVNRVWVRTEGEGTTDGVKDGTVELLLGRSFSPWWDVVAGVRHDFGDGPARTYAAFGLQGLAPYKFEVEATIFLGPQGRGGATLEAEYDTLITNRLILQWQVEANVYAKADPETEIGSGFSTVEAGARLRYEYSRRFAPYVGVEVEQAFGSTADIRRNGGEPTRDTRLVAGIRFWF